MTCVVGVSAHLSWCPDPRVKRKEERGSSNLEQASHCHTCVMSQPCPLKIGEGLQALSRHTVQSNQPCFSLVVITQHNTSLFS